MPNKMLQAWRIRFLSGVLIILLTGTIFHSIASTISQKPTSVVQKDNEELTRLFTQDQSDRRPPDGKTIDWKIVTPRDRYRIERVKELYQADSLHTGKDYFHAAMILQHASTPDDYLLAHELAVVAISLREEGAKWLAAATEDRFLMNIGRPQRFGTQYIANNNQPLHLYQVSPGVTDGLRRALNVTSLAQARQREAEMNKR